MQVLLGALHEQEPGPVLRAQAPLYEQRTCSAAKS